MRQGKLLAGLWFCFELSVMASVPVAFASMQPEYPIQRDTVIAAILAAHPELSGDSVKMAMSVDAREPLPQLLVGPVQEVLQKASAQNARLGRIEVHCAKAAECLPFVTWVRLPAGFAPQNASRDSLRAGASLRAVSETIVDSQAEIMPRAVHSSPAGSPMVHHGERVRLILDSGLLHVSFPAFCMQDAAIGGSVRVRSAKGRREYIGLVVNANTVRGAL